MMKLFILPAFMALAGLASSQVPEIENKPVATVAGLRNGDPITKENLSAQVGVGVYVYTGVHTSAEQRKAAGKLVYTITRFRATVMRNGAALFTSENDGSLFNKETKTAFADMKPGDMLVLSAISAVRKNSSGSPAGTEEHLSSILYEIK